MCRFVLYLGDPLLLSSLVTEPDNSVINQSFHSREASEPLNGDGFGIVWYVPEISGDAAQFRSITPAWSNQNLRHLARMTKSGCVLAHVRAASPGLPVTETNTHPFVCGPYSFMHNGDVAGFQEMKRPLLDTLSTSSYRMIEGTTDSEHLFAVFLDALALQQDRSAASMGRALETTIRRILEFADRLGIDGTCYLNVAVANGAEAVVCRYSSGPAGSAPSLHLHTGKLYACHEGAPKLLDCDDGGHAVIVASEPLTGDSTWSVIPEGHMVVVDRRRMVELRPVRVA